MKNIRISSVFFFIFLITGIPSLTSQENTVKPRITVKKLAVSDPDNIQLQVISERITGSTELVLKFMNEYEFGTSTEILSVEETDSSMLEYCNRNNIDNIVYGKTYIGSDNSFVIEMSVFSREKGQTALTRIGRAETALDVFDAADRLTAAIIEEFSGVHIAFGKIHLSNMGAEGSFIPYVDGEPFPDDSSTLENLLIGNRTVEIRQNRMLGETSVFTQEVTVAENSITEVLFYIPYLLPAESEVIEGFNKIIEKNYNKVKRKEKVIRAFSEIDSELANTPWNRSLSELREEYRKKRAEYEANLEQLAKRGKREFIIGGSLGVNISSAESGLYNEDSNYDPIDINEWNRDSTPGPSFGVNMQYQIFNNLYIQTEFNYKEIYLSDYGGMDNMIQIIEIPLLFKFTERFSRHRFSIYLGPSFFNVVGGDGIFEKNYYSADFTRLDPVESDVALVLGLEYGYQKDRHLLTAGIRYTNLNSLDYSYYDPDANEDKDGVLKASAYEFILGYGYNFGGNGKIEKEENADKWLLAADAGFMVMLGMDENNTVPIGGFGFLRKISKNYYAGIRGFMFSGGGSPMLSLAYTKDPDKVIHNYSFAVFPIMDMLVGAFQYNIGIKRISFAVLAGGPLENMEDLGIGFAAGYFF